MKIKKIIRWLCKSRENESFNDTLDRHKTTIEKKIFRRKYTLNELKSELEKCGLSQGDTVFIHSSWRKFYNLNARPEDVIYVIESIIGENGTIAMPCYGAERTFMDVKNSPSVAGVLSETFRKMEGVKRSHCTHFAVASKGVNTDFLLDEHEKSIYGFDEHSPCFKLTLIPNAKILFLGLGSVPTKISVFHCAGASLLNIDKKISALLSNHYTSILIDENNNRQEKDMVIRQPGHGNNKRVFRKIFKSISSKTVSQISNLDIVIIGAKEAYDKALKFAQEGDYCYYNMDKL